MSETKRARHDWNPHLPKMIELYKTGLPFREICEAIQTPEFKPCEKAVYDKLLSEGWPGNKAKRADLCKRLDIAGWPHEVRSIMSRPDNRYFFDSTNTRQEMHSMASSHTMPQWYDPSHSKSRSDQVLCHGSPNRAWPSNFPQPNADGSSSHNKQLCLTTDGDLDITNDQEWLDTTGYLSGSAQSLNREGDLNTNPPTILHCPLGSLHTPLLQPEASLQLSRNELDDTSFLMEDTLMQSTTGAQLLSFKQSVATPFDMPALTDTSSPFSTVPLPSTPRIPGPTVVPSSIARQVDRRKPKNRGSKVFYPDRNSSSTYDSGYISGCSSPFPFQNISRQARRPAPPAPFEGLYRVSCKTSHEPRPYNISFSPQPSDRYKDIASCHYCRYSAIHNLSWSAQYLKFEVFASELNLSNVYDMTALDAAGNSALHYAAAGGARIEYIIALMQAGVNPCQINTAGELFLHCFKPRFNQTKRDFEADIFPAFKTNLINLLNDLDQSCSGFFRWRENGGRTALNTFISSITDHDIKSRIAETVTSAGYTLDVPSPDKDTMQQTLHDVSYTSLHINPEDPFDFNKLKQQIAKEIERYALTEPSYIHPETGDNILHALARLRFQEPTHHISRIREFASQDLDLNQRNWNDDGPLSVFTQEPPAAGVTEDETGATISKYLDALLWKDPQKRVPSRINVNMRNRDGLTPLYYAAIRGRPDSVRSLIEAGANVNARVEIDGKRISILDASEKEKDRAYREYQVIRWDRLNNVISYLEHAKAVLDPTLFQERCVMDNTVGLMPM